MVKSFKPGCLIEKSDYLPKRNKVRLQVVRKTKGMQASSSGGMDYKSKIILAATVQSFGKTRAQFWLPYLNNIYLLWRQCRKYHRIDSKNMYNEDRLSRMCQYSPQY